MKFLPLLAAVVTLLYLLIKNRARSKKKKRLLHIRGRWGVPDAGYHNFDQIEKYSRLNKATSFHKLNSQTKSDIDFNDVFLFADRCSSKPGQQYLYDALSNPSGDASALRQLDAQAVFFSRNQAIREETQLLLSELNDEHAYHIASLLSGEFPDKPGWYNLVLADVAVTLLLLGLSAHFPVLLAWLMIPLAVNLGLHYWNKNNTFYFSASLPQLNRLINTCRALCRMALPFENKQVVKSILALKMFQRTMRLLGLRQSSMGADAELIVYYLADIIKALFLVELIAYFSLVKELKKRHDDMYSLFKYVGAIDTALSIASLRDSGTTTCTPVFTAAERLMLVKNVYHPLVEECVTNNVTVMGKGMLITGSNMSGKTTFLRTMAINAVLAQTLYTCFAESYEAPLLKVFSSIRINDSLMDGKSYYFEEVNIMKSLVQEVETGHQCLFVLDEVFKGTNTIERIASAKAILTYLNKNNHIVLVATHDIELSGMLQQAYELYHFEENIVADQLQFDHKLKAGQLKTRNAIRILEMAAYPAEITEEASAISKKLSEGGQGLIPGP